MRSRSAAAQETAYISGMFGRRETETPKDKLLAPPEAKQKGNGPAGRSRGIGIPGKDQV